MAEERIPLFSIKLPPDVWRQVRGVLESGWLNTGPKTAEFERSIAALTGAKYSVAVSSATTGLQASLEALGAGPGREVITSSFTFAATAAAIIRTGAMPVLADIDPVTLNIDPDEVTRKVSPRTLCIMPVDMAGHPADYPELQAISAKRRLPIISDSAHSLGATVGRKAVARVVDVAVHSFQATKNLTTADGGMVLTHHQPVAERVRLLSQHATTSNAYERKKARRWDYDVLGPGLKANLTDVHAAIGLGQLSSFAARQTQRQKLAERYCRNLRSLSEYVAPPIVKPGFTHSWHLYIIRLHLSRLRIGRARFVALMSEAGIDCGVHYKPLFEMSFYRSLGFTPQFFPNAAYAGKRVVSLPMYPHLTTAQVDRVCDAVRDIVLKYRR
ncbi:MAG: DegT/DnrJ/EryC1/StrS family aminotransferase [Candidatus Zixiibacteriota bacterium]